jgi:hypothetical protein
VISHVTDASDRLVVFNLVGRTRRRKHNLAAVRLNALKQLPHFRKSFDFIKVLSLKQVGSELFDLLSFVIRHPRWHERRDETVGTFPDVTADLLKPNLDAKPGEGVDPRRRVQVHAIDQCTVDIENYSLQHHAPQYNKMPATTLNAAMAARIGHASKTLRGASVAVRSGICMRGKRPAGAEGFVR